VITGHIFGKNAMKTKMIGKAIIVMLMVVFSALSTSGANNPETTCAEKMWKKMSEQVKYPGFAVRDRLEGQVTIIYTVTEQGKILIKRVITDESRLAEYVRLTLSGLQCEEMIKVAGKDFKVQFHFRLI
jgi:hypothetical protein